MNPASFDGFTKALGATQTRRGLLRSFMAGIVAAAVGIPRQAAAQTGLSCRSDIDCPPHLGNTCIAGKCVYIPPPTEVVSNPCTQACEQYLGQCLRPGTNAAKCRSNFEYCMSNCHSAW
jgi:hypothetical protein